MHLVGDAGGLSYIKESSVHHSYFRAVAVHGSNNVLVSGNVAYDIVGHAYYLEDGVEENNTFAYNLGAFVHFLGIYDPQFKFNVGQYLSTTVADPVHLIVPSDITASAFYITNAYNTYIGNAASGGWCGFAFPYLATPLNENFGVKMVPNTRPVKLFDGNSAHSTGYWWDNAGGIYVGGVFLVDSTGSNPTYNPGRDQGRQFYPTSTSVYTNSKVFLANTGFMHWGVGEEIGGMEAADISAIGLQVFGVGVYMHQYLVTGRTRHRPDLLNGCKASLADIGHCANRDSNFYNEGYRGFQWYDIA